MARRKMIVVVEQEMKLPFRKSTEKVTREYTVYASTKAQARNAVRRAGHKGRVIEVIG